MATNESFNRGDPLSLSGENTNFSHQSLLDLTEHCASYSSSSSGNYLTLLCFENPTIEDKKGLLLRETETTTTTATATATTTTSASSSSNNSGGSTSFVTKYSKRTQSGKEKAHELSTPSSGTSTVTVESRKVCKRPKLENKNRNPSSSTGPAKVRKEKVGERITALQQLVSPFGKTDTASVLHEAMGYIRFLHDQVQVLSSPYLQRLPSSSGHLNKDNGGEDEEKKEGTSKQDLRSRGLCLVPISCTGSVANCNGADLWSPAMGSNFSKH